MKTLWHLYNIRDRINKEFNVKIQEQSRLRDVVYARKIFCKIAYENYRHLSLTTKGKVIGIKHDTLIHHANTFYTVYDVHKEFYNKLIGSTFRLQEDKRKDALKLALFYRDRLNKILGTEWQ